MTSGSQPERRDNASIRARASASVTADVVLPLPADVAAARLERAFHGAGHDGHVLLTVGPARRGGIMSKRVRATLAPEQRRGPTEVFALRWEPVGPGASAYPSLDARLGVTPVDDTCSLLSIVARYRPPLGAFGATVDRAAMSRVADATVTAVLHQLAQVITHPSRPLGGRPADARPVVRSVTP